MINGFEEITYDLTDEEIELVPDFIMGFASHIGEENCISNKEIRERFAKRNIKIGDPRVRKVINFIRREQIITGLISNSKGYWIELDQRKVKKYRDSLVQRANEIYATADSFSGFKAEPVREHFKFENLNQHIKNGIDKVINFINKLFGG